jgi:hypothetical protein
MTHLLLSSGVTVQDEVVLSSYAGAQHVRL